MRYLLPLLCFLPMMSCDSSPSSQETNQEATAADLKSEIPGTWETVSFRVTVNALDSLNEPSVFEVEENAWLEKMGVQPIQTQFTDDNKFRQEYLDRSDSLLQLTRGIWNIFGDTLMLIAPDATYQYQVDLQGERAEFRCYLDWDGDGQADDEYVGLQRVVREQ
jgi:hypothetical protein